jgi:hypothetical protein
MAYLDFKSEEAIKINTNTSINYKYSLSYLFVILNILLLILSLFYVIHLSFIDYFSKHFFEINKPLSVLPEENNRQIQNTELGKETSFFYHFSSQDYFKNPGIDYPEDLNTRYINFQRILFIELLKQGYFDPNINNLQWGKLFDVQFRIFAKLNPNFDLETRMKMVDIYYADLILKNELPLNKLVLRQIAELKHIQILDFIMKDPKYSQNPETNPERLLLFKYLNYQGGALSSENLNLNVKDIEANKLLEGRVEGLEVELLAEKKQQDTKLP